MLIHQHGKYCDGQLDPEWSKQLQPRIASFRAKCGSEDCRTQVLLKEEPLCAVMHKSIAEKARAEHHSRGDVRKNE